MNQGSKDLSSSAKPSLKSRNFPPVSSYSLSLLVHSSSWSYVLTILQCIDYLAMWEHGGRVTLKSQGFSCSNLSILWREHSCNLIFNFLFVSSWCRGPLSIHSCVLPWSFLLTQDGPGSNRGVSCVHPNWCNQQKCRRRRKSQATSMVVKRLQGRNL